MSAIERAFGKVHKDFVLVNRRIDIHGRRLSKISGDIKDLKTSLIKEMKADFKDAVNTQLANSSAAYTKKSDLHLEKNLKEMQAILSKVEKIEQKIDNKIKRLGKSIEKQL